MTDNSAFLHERLLRLILAEDSPLKEDVRLTLLKIMNEEVNRQNESLFAEEIKNVRKYHEYLRAMGANVSGMASNLIEVEKRFDAVMTKQKAAEAKRIATLKDGIAVLHPIIKEFNRAKDDVKRLRHEADAKADEVLRILCHQIEPVAWERLYRIFTQDL